MSSATATGLATTQESAQAQPRCTLGFTFDDGLDETWTPRVLEQLARCEVTATFFMVGERVRVHPELARTVLAAGHEIQLYLHDAIGSGARRAGCQNTIALLSALAAAARAGGLALAPTQHQAIGPPAIEVPA